jgi:2-hydroxy-6-oxonona-2,4-dienedioate hydrolase
LSAFPRVRALQELALRHPNKIAALILLVPGLYSPTSPVSIEASRGSKFAFWVVSVGGDFAWWAARQIAPSVLVRFVGVRPALLWAAPEAERDRVLNIVKNVEPLSLRFRGINIDSNPDLHELPLEEIVAPALIISARDDLFNALPAAQFAASKISGAKLIVYEKGGHLLVGHKRDVRVAVRMFLSSIRSDSTNPEMP